MVEKVKKNLEVSKGYMKSFERDRMLIEAGRNEGRNEERANTERERLRAQKETKRADEAEQTVEYLKRIMHEYGIVV